MLKSHHHLVNATSGNKTVLQKHLQTGLFQLHLPVQRGTGIPMYNHQSLTVCRSL